jgi:hypothetical protein
MRALLVIGAIILALALVGGGEKGGGSNATATVESKTVSHRAADDIEMAKPRPDWSKVGTRLSAQCAEEIMAKRASPQCEAEGKVWNEGLQRKLNDPRFKDDMEREFGKYMR